MNQSSLRKVILFFILNKISVRIGTLGQKTQRTTSGCRLETALRLGPLHEWNVLLSNRPWKYYEIRMTHLAVCRPTPLLRSPSNPCAVCLGGGLSDRHDFVRSFVPRHKLGGGTFDPLTPERRCGVRLLELSGWLNSSSCMQNLCWDLGEYINKHLPPFPMHPCT